MLLGGDVTTDLADDSDPDDHGSDSSDSGETYEPDRAPESGSGSGSEPQSDRPEPASKTADAVINLDPSIDLDTRASTEPDPNPTHPLDNVARELEGRSSVIFEHLYDIMADRMFRVALRMLGDFHEAQDAVQQAFLELARTPDLPTEGRSLQAWLYTSVRFNCLDTQRHRDRRPAVPFSQVPDTTDEPLDFDLGLDPALEAALQLLTPDQRLVIHLKHVEGLDGNEIAEIIDSTRVAVYAMAARAERRMRHFLERSGESGRPT